MTWPVNLSSLRRAGRLTVPWVLLVAAAMLGCAAVLVTFGARVVLTQEVVPAAAGELIEDPVVRAAIAQRASTALVDAVDADRRLRAALPEELAPLAGPLASGVEDATARGIDRLLDTATAQRLWRVAATEANEQLTRVLRDENSTIRVDDAGVVTLDLSPLIATVAKEVGIDRPVPPDLGTVVLAQSDQLATARTLTQLTSVVSAWAFPLVLLLFALAVWLALARRRMFVGIGVAVVVVALLLQRANAWTRDWAVESFTTADTAAAGARAYDILTRSFTTTLTTMILVGVIIALAALWVGPSRLARAVRRPLAPLLVVRWRSWALVLALALLAVLLYHPLLALGTLPLLTLLALTLALAEILHRTACADSLQAS